MTPEDQSKDKFADHLVDDYRDKKGNPVPPEDRSEVRAKVEEQLPAAVASVPGLKLQRTRKPKAAAIPERGAWTSEKDRTVFTDSDGVVRAEILNSGPDSHFWRVNIADGIQLHPCKTLEAAKEYVDRHLFGPQ
jgi:hypothetical protein